MIASILWVLAYQRCGVAAEFDCLYSEVFLTRNAWEKRKLNYFLHVNEIKNKSEIYSKKDVLSVSGEFGIVNQIELQGRSFAGSSVKNYGVVELGDVVYTKSPLKKNPFGIVKVNRNKAGIVSTLYAIYKPQTTLYSPIIDYYFQSDCRVNNYLKPLVNKGAKNDMKVKNVDVLKGNVTIPSEIDEQRTIVGLLNKLDKLIAATQDKIDALEQAKKALLQRLFDQSWRLKGYSDPWEKRKLTELSKNKIGGGTPSTKVLDFWNGKLPWLQSSDINESNNYSVKPQKFISLQALKHSAAKRVPANSIAVVTRVGVGKLALIEYDYSTSQDFLSFSSLNWSALFSVNLLTLIMTQMSRESQGTSIKGVTKSELLAKKVRIPISLKEQEKLGILMKSINDLIAATQSRLSSLELLKKYLLQDLFI